MRIKGLRRSKRRGITILVKLLFTALLLFYISFLAGKVSEFETREVENVE